MSRKVATKTSLSEKSKLHITIAAILFGCLVISSILWLYLNTNQKVPKKQNPQTAAEIYAQLLVDNSDLLNTTALHSAKIKQLQNKTSALETRIQKLEQLQRQLNANLYEHIQKASNDTTLNGVRFRCQANEFAVQLVTYTEVYHALEFQKTYWQKFPNSWIRSKKLGNNKYLYQVRSQCYKTAEPAQKLIQSLQHSDLHDAYLLKF